MSRRPVLFGAAGLEHRWDRPAVPDDPPPGRAPEFPPQDLPRVFVQGGEVFATGTPSIGVTILGSCISVCLWDPGRGIGGMNHFLLPWDGEEERGLARHCRSAVILLLARVTALGARADCIRAKLIGGASNIGLGMATPPLGTRNTVAARALLAELGIPIVLEDVGGSLGRKLHFETATGETWIRKL